jgi:SAM-dependent methyltransferase
MHRELILAHQVVRFTKMDKVPAIVNVLDVACGYAEQFTLLSRIMKAGGTKLKYVGVDIDEDKKVVAQQLRSTVDFRIMDILDIKNITDVTFNVIICGETIEHVEEAKAIEFMSVMCSVLEHKGFLIMSFPTKMSETHRDNPFHIRLWDLLEVIEIMKANDMEILDAFHLGVPKAWWGYSTERIPAEIFRTAMSAMVGSEAPGPDAILVCQKTWE